MSVLGVVGAAAGFFLGGPQGAMLGYSIGSGVDALVNQPNIEGPRLEDLEVQMAAYGSPIPHDWGVNRHVGTVIWPKNLELKESSHTESAKGGPETTTYSYSCSIAVLLCEGPIKGVRRIWANKKLVYDASVDNTGPTKDPAISAMRLYRGTEDQEVDPLIEATDGPSPAYLGYAYVVFEDFDLTEYANRPPQFEFEVITEGEEAPDAPPEKFADILPSSNVGRAVLVPDNGTLWVVNGSRTSTAAQTGGDLNGPTINVYDLATKELLSVISNGTDSGTSGFGVTGWRDYGDLTYSAGVVYTSTDVSQTLAGNAAYGFGVESMSQIATVPFPSTGEGWPDGTGASAAVSDGMIISAGSGSLFSNGIAVWNAAAGLLFRSDISGVGNVTRAITLDDARVVLLASTGIHIIQPSNPVIVTSVVSVEDLGGSEPTHVAYDPDEKRLLVSTAIGLWAVDVADPAGAVEYITKIVDGFVYASVYDPINKMYYAAQTSALVAVNAASMSVDREVSLLGMNDRVYDMHLSLSTGEVIFVDTSSLWAMKVDIGLAPAKIPLSKIVGDICTMKDGLSPSDIDVTQLTPLVDGYILSRQMTRRAAIEALQPIYHFDAVENGGKLQFVMRGGAVAATIDMEDRAARDFGGDLPDSLSVVRAQDLELPYEVELEYPDVDADHLVGAQYSRRITKDTKQKTNLQTAVVMTAEKAKSVTAVNLYEAWLQGSFKWTTTRKYSHLLPTDVVELPTKEALYRGRITSKREQPNGIIEWEAKQEAVDVYTQSGAGAAPTNYVSQSIFTPGRTVLELLDIPLVRDVDAGKGFPVAMAGTSASWPGAQLFKSSDSGSTYGALFSQTGAAVIGTAATALGNFTDGDVFDEGNSVTVKIQPGGQLISYTTAQLLDGTSAFALGVNGRWEIVQCRTATLVAPLTYKLTGLLRGRRGTEWAASTHQAGDHFILLNGGGVQFYDPGVADVNVQRLYKAPAFRAALSSATAVPFTDTLVRLRPYSVANLKVEDIGNAYLITWAHRSILGGGWRDGGDVPLDAAFVAFDVSILKLDGTVIKTYSTAEESFTYSDVDAFNDFGGAPGDFKVRVAQRNSDYGQGVGVTVATNGAALAYDVPAPMTNPGTTPGGSTGGGGGTPVPDTTDAWHFDSYNNFLRAELGSDGAIGHLGVYMTTVWASTTHVAYFGGMKIKDYTISGGASFSEANPDAYVFNRATGVLSKSPLAFVPSGQGYYTGGVIGNQYVVVDGSSGTYSQGAVARRVYRYDFSNPASPTRLDQMTANGFVDNSQPKADINDGVVCNGKIWFPSSGSVWDASTNLWASMPVPPVDCRYRPLLGAIGSTLYFLGGTTIVRDPLYQNNPGPVQNQPDDVPYKKEVWAFDTVAGTWSRKADLPYAVAARMVGAQSTSPTRITDPNFSKRLLVQSAGGKLYLFDAWGKILQYDPAANTWATFSNAVSNHFSVSGMASDGTAIWVASDLDLPTTYGISKAQADLSLPAGLKYYGRLLYRFTPSNL